VGGLDELLGSETVTGKKGAFKIEGLGTGSYTLRFDPTCNFEQVSPYLKASRKFRVTGGHDRHLRIVPLRVGARLTGVVRDSSGHRLAGVCVDVEDRGIDHAKTGPNGTYSIGGIGPGKDAVSFSSCSTATSVVGQFYNDRPNEQTANKITFRAGKTVSGIDATMQPAGTLTGLVTDRSGRPLARVCVGIVSAGTADLIDSGFVRSIRTSPNGRYVLRNITPGPYQVSIGCDGGPVAPRWFDNQQDSALGNFLSIAGGQVTTLNGKVGPPGAIAGDVTSQSGKPLGNICVEIADAKTRNFIDNNPGGIGPRVTVHGHYQIGGLTPGRYLVNFSECGGGKWADQWYRNGTTIASARAVTVRPGQTTTGINQVLADGGLISGTVTDSSGQPVRNICVQAFDPASLGFGEAATGRTGHYTISGLDSGQYSVYFAPCSVKGANLGGASARTLVTVTRPRTTTVNIKLKAGGTISGKVLGGANGKAPQAGTCVLAVPNDPNGSLQPVVTRNDGTYLLPDLAPGKYRLYFGDLYCINLNFFSSPEATTAPQWFQNQAAEAAATTITVTSGHTNTGINATMHQYGTISGTVRTPSNGPVSGECVTAVPTEPQFDQAFDEPIPDVSAITTAAGRYTLIALPGQYKIKFSAGCGDSGFATQWWNGASSAKIAQLVTVAYGTTKGVDATLHH
jgi:protocatechuate 3,4-dioxygenase beta subunit